MFGLKKLFLAAAVTAVPMLATSEAQADHRRHHRPRCDYPHYSRYAPSYRAGRYNRYVPSYRGPGHRNPLVGPSTGIRSYRYGYGFGNPYSAYRYGYRRGTSFGVGPGGFSLFLGR